MKSRRIIGTNNYSIFTFNKENREVDPTKHKKLIVSMEKYGFLPSFPVVVYRTIDGKLLIKDGQHRVKIAKSLGLPVYYVEEPIDFDIAVINSTAKIWTLRDYAKKFAANGMRQYQDGLDFSEQYELPLSTTFALLAGVTSFSICQNAFILGKWRKRDEPWANQVATVYSSLVKLNRVVKNARLMEACMGACRVKDFKPGRLTANASRCTEKLQAYSTRDAYLDMIEAIYNYGRKDLLGVKSAAIMEMRRRSMGTAKKDKVKDSPQQPVMNDD